MGGGCDSGFLVCFRKSLSVGAHLRFWGAFEPHTSISPDGIDQRVGGEGEVGGPQAHVLLKAFDDRPIGPDTKMHRNNEPH